MEYSRIAHRIYPPQIKEMSHPVFAAYATAEHLSLLSMTDLEALCEQVGLMPCKEETHEEAVKRLASLSMPMYMFSDSQLRTFVACLGELGLNSSGRARIKAMSRADMLQELFKMATFKFGATATMMAATKRPRESCECEITPESKMTCKEMAEWKEEVKVRRAMADSSTEEIQKRTCLKQKL